MDSNNPVPPIATLVLLAGVATSPGQDPASLGATTPPPAELSTEEHATDKDWNFGLSAYTYILPEERDYVQPTISLDRDWLHLEARYNYEAEDAGSLWIGYNLAGEGRIGWEFTPMIGGVFGNLRGIAPGYKGSLNWWKLEFYTEGEFVFDTQDSSANFFYSWSELSVAPWPWLRLGLVAQRTRLYDAERDTQRGLLIGLDLDRYSLTTYVFNPDDSDPVVVVGVNVAF